MTIRKASPHDQESIKKLLLQLGYNLSTQELERKLALFMRDTYNLLVGEDEHEVVAFIALHIFEAFHLPGKTGRITSFCVHENRRGKGIGKKLLQAAEISLRAAGCERIEVTSNNRRKDAHIFYMHQNFEGSSQKFVKVLQ